MCGTRYGDGDQNAAGYACQQCGFFLYNNQILAIGIVPVSRDRQRILLVRRARDPGKGKWDVAGGFVDIHETCEEACRREALEELGVGVSALVLYGVYGPEPYSYQNYTHLVAAPYYLATLVDEDAVRPADDAAEAVWFPLDELPAPHDLAFSVLPQALLDAVRIIRNNNEHA